MTDTEQPPEEGPQVDRLRRADSLVLVNTGNGKGKSSAAFGVILRAKARGWNVGVMQFLKSGKWHVGEEKICREIGVDWWAMGDGFTWDSDDLSEDEAIAKSAWAKTKATIESGDYRLVVLDEITYPMNWGWIDTAEVVQTIADRPKATSVICTGRDAPAELIEIADTVTEMVEVKHAFQAGIRAKAGIDY